MNKIYLVFLSITLLLFPQIFATNGIWTYVEDVRAGVFGADENLDPLVTYNYTFIDIVYFNQDLVSTNINVTTNLDVGDNVTARIFVDRENPNFFAQLSGQSAFRDITANNIFVSTLFSVADNSFFIRPHANSVVNNLDVRGVISYKGSSDIDDRFVLEGQINSITQQMIQNNAVTLNKLDTSSVDQRYVNRAGDTMTGDLSLGGRNINSVNQITVSSIVFGSGVVVSGGGSGGGGGVTLPTPPNCSLNEALTWQSGSWQCVSLSGGTGGSNFGGMFNRNLDGSCRYANHNTGSCSCPTGTSPVQVSDFTNPTCEFGLYADGFRTSNCGVQLFQCQ